MIQLRSECLMFTLPDGGAVPCSVEEVTVELIGEVAENLSPDLLQNAASAVLHYFRVEQGKTLVSVGEFAMALARVLRNLGLTVSEPELITGPEDQEAPLDLRHLATESGSGRELFFFPLLKQALRTRLQDTATREKNAIRLTGLRGCVKQILGARRWSFRCQTFSDEIVGYIRDCFDRSSPPPHQRLDLR